jgi:hypothetical protein
MARTKIADRSRNRKVTLNLKPGIDRMVPANVVTATTVLVLETRRYEKDQKTEALLR